MALEGHVLIVLHEVPDPREPDVRVAQLFWRRSDGGWRSTGTTSSTIEPLRAHVETFDRAADILEARVDAAACARDWFDVLHAAAPLVRTARNLSRTLQEARELARGDHELISLRDQAQEIERALELIHGHARDGLDFTIALNAEESARASQHASDAGHRLNLITATFLPITALGSLLGINLQHGLERWSAPWLFWIVAVAAFGLGLAVRASLPKPPAP